MDNLAPPGTKTSISNWRKVWQIILTIIGPFQLFSLYHWDILTDINNIVSNLYANCQTFYGNISVGIMVTSYITTSMTLRFQLGKSWISSLGYPYFHM